MSATHYKRSMESGVLNICHESIFWNAFGNLTPPFSPRLQHSGVASQSTFDWKFFFPEFYLSSWRYCMGRRTGEYMTNSTLTRSGIDKLWANIYTSVFCVTIRSVSLFEFYDLWTRICEYVLPTYRFRGPCIRSRGVTYVTGEMWVMITHFR